MLTKLKLTNFRGHEDLEITFTEGLNVLRGANEAGKSTIFEAILYACYGARALVEPLDLTVTWGKDVKTLSVSLDLIFAGQAYSIRRSKTGASLTFGTTLVSGQSEVTAFVERLFGVPLNTAIQIQFAAQSQLKASVDAGIATVALIESLSGLDEIDTIIDKIQTQLICGTPVPLEMQIAELSKLQAPVEDFTEEQDCIDEALTELNEALHEFLALEAKHAEIPKAALSKVLVQRQLEDSAIASLQQRIAIAASQPQPIKPNYPPVQEIDEREAEHIKMQDLKTVYALYERLPVKVCNTSLALVIEQIARAKNSITATQAAIREDELESASLEAQLIKDKECTLCGKDLADVPEVIAKNAAISQRILELAEKITVSKLWLESLQSALKGLEQSKKDLEAAHKLAKESEHIELTESREFTGVRFLGDVEAITAYTLKDYNYYSTARKAWQAYEVALASHAAHAKTIDDYVEELQKLKANQTDTTEATQKLLDAATLEMQIAVVRNTARERERVYDGAVSKLETAMSLYIMRKSEYEQQYAIIESAKSQLATLHFHNGLLRKLREARPIVGAQLWTLVLGAVSTIFSAIRGEPSRVTRSPEGFLVNGRSVKSLSGSTKDSLGLALRYGLQRTFLPLVDFILVDEPASGCDDRREEAMIGQLSSCGYAQVLLVTHSDLADAFATNLIRI